MRAFVLEAYSTGLKVIVAQDKTPKRGCSDLPSTILIDSVPVHILAVNRV